MRDDVESINRGHAGALAVGQAQAAADRLLDQHARIGGAQRYDGVEISHVPTFLEHVDVDNDFRRLIRVFHLEQPRNHFFFLRARLAGVDLDDLLFVARVEEALGLNQAQ